MYRREIDNLSHSAEVKIGLFNKSVPKYLTSAMLGSLFVSLGIMLIYSIGGIILTLQCNQLFADVSIM